VPAFLYYVHPSYRYRRREQFHRRPEGSRKRERNARNQGEGIHRPYGVVIVIIGILQPASRMLSVRHRQAIEVGVDDRGVLVIPSGMHVLKRRYSECLEQRKASRYRGCKTHPLPVYAIFDMF
jgi:hypothetical protein